MADAVTVSADERAHGGLITYAMLFFAVGQLISPIFSAAFGGSFTTADRSGEPPLTPAGYTFSIWFVIEICSVGYAIFAVRRRGMADAGLIDRLAVPLLVVFAGFSVWLIAAEAEPVWSTLVIIVIMFVALVKALRIALAERARIAAWPRLGSALLWWTLGLYTGWISVAMWLNLTTAFAGSGAPITGTLAVVAQLATLAGALGTAVIILRWTGGLIPYAAAVCWGLIGAVVGTLAAGQPVLTIGASVGLVVVVATTLLCRRRPTAQTRDRTAARFGNPETRSDAPGT